MIFYSAHNGKSMYYRVSERPEDISEWSKGNAFLHSSNSYLVHFQKNFHFVFTEFEITNINSQGIKGYTYPNPMLLNVVR